MKQLPDFDLSIVMLLNKPLSDYVPLSPSMLKYYERNGIEVVIVINGATERTEVMDYITTYPFISWKVAACNEQASWQIPAKAFNIGIRQATKQYIFIMNEEQEFYTDVIYELREKLDSYSEHYAIGQSLTMDNWEKLNDQTLEKQYHKLTPCGNIMAKKEYFERIGGYCESNNEWSLEFDHLRSRLELAGIHRLLFLDSVMIHRTDNSLSTVSYNEQRTQIPQHILTEKKLPSEINVNGENWGNISSTVVYDWKKHPFAERQCWNYLSVLKQFDITSDEVFKKSYPLIALIPTYNESERITDCLRSVEKYCDGIILLDDDSTDDTYQIAQSEKLLVKAKKQRTEFNDKQNRNILLDIASFFKAEWFIFIDADERFDERFVDLRNIINKKEVDVVSIWIANLWDNVETYRIDMEDTHLLSQNGLWFRWRMLRNKGRMQFYTNKCLHFVSIPYFNDKIWFSNTLVLHSGYLRKEYRKKKYEFYLEEDKEGLFFYDDIRMETVKLQKVGDINIDCFIIGKKYNIKKI